MSAQDIPPSVRAFIAEHIRSVAELEVLLLLFHDASRQWTAIELAQTLRVALDWIERNLAGLIRNGLVTKTDGDPATFSFASGAPLGAVIGQLEHVYKERRVTVIDLIFSKPIGPIQSFADAFKLRKD